MNENLRRMLVCHEGLSLKPYVDTVGKVTIGVGRNLTDNGITKAECDAMFEHDVAVAEAVLISIFPECPMWTEARRNALVDMLFNMGEARFLRFTRMIAAIRRFDWMVAAAEMRDSQWATQVPGRVAELAAMVEAG